MPRGDGTGPLGGGAMTGRGAGFCVGAGASGAFNGTFCGGYGRSMGRKPASCRGMNGGGRGMRNMFRLTGQAGWARFSGMPTESVEQNPGREWQVLKSQADSLAAELAFIKNRLAEIDKAEQEEIS